MASSFHAHASLIKAIGASVVRSHFGQSPQALYAWRVRGIPYTHRGAFAQLAALHSVAIPADFFLPPAKAAA